MADIRSNQSEVLHYDNPMFRVFFRKNYILANEKLYDVSIHWHDEPELIYVTKGYTNYRLNGRSVRIRAGEGIFVNAGQLHLIEPGTEDCELFCLIFHPMVIGNSEYLYKTYVVPVIENEDMPYLMLSENVAWQARILKAVAGMEPYYNASDELRVLGILHGLWDDIYRNAGIFGGGRPGFNHSLECARKMMNFIHENYAGKIGLSDIAAAGMVGRTKCTEVFSRYLNQTPMEYLCTFRIDLAAGFLRETDDTITEIAYRVGFANSSYFTKSFRSVMGVSPREFRKGCGKCE